jgi:glyoxylase I family protein
VIRGLHHVSRTVANLERSLSFYRDLLGLRVVSEEELEGPDLDKVVGLTDARLRVIELSLGGDSLLELIEYQSPIAQALPDTASPADVGANHIALLVDDLAAVYAALSAA